MWPRCSARVRPRRPREAARSAASERHTSPLSTASLVDRCATSPVGGAGGGGWRSLWGGGGRKSRPDDSSFGRRGGSGGGLEGASSFGGGGCGSLEGEVLDPDAPPLEITDRASSYHFFTTPRASNPCRGSCECRGSMAAPSPPGYSSAPARRLANFSAEPGARNSAGPAWDLASPRGGRSDAHSFGQGAAASPAAPPCASEQRIFTPRGVKSRPRGRLDRLAAQHDGVDARDSRRRALAGADVAEMEPSLPPVEPRCTKYRRGATERYGRGEAAV